MDNQVSYSDLKAKVKGLNESGYSTVKFAVCRYNGYYHLESIDGSRVYCAGSKAQISLWLSAYVQGLNEGAK